MVRRHWRACWVQPWTPKLGLVKRIGSQPCAEEEWTAPARAATIPTRAAVRGICVRDASPMIDLLTCASSSSGWREDRTKPALEECRVDRTRVDEAHHTVGPDEHGGGQCNQTVAASGFPFASSATGKGMANSLTNLRISFGYSWSVRFTASTSSPARSEERRVGKECRS